MTSRLRVGVSGCGKLAREVHLVILRQMPEVEIVALADPDERARKAAGEMSPSAERYTTLEEMMEESGPDAVVVASPTGEHARQAEIVLNQKKALYLEKPMAATLEEAERLAGHAEAWRGTMGFNYRHHPLWRLGLEAVRDKEWRMVETEFSTAPKAMPEWKKSRANGGGVLLDLGVHHLDFFVNLLGWDVEKVEAEIGSRQTEADTAEVKFWSQRGTVAQCRFSLCGEERDRFEFRGNEGPYRMDRYAPWSYPKFPPAGFVRYQWERLGSPWREPSHRRALGNWVERVRSGRSSDAPLSEGLRVQRLVAQMEEAARRR